MAIVGTPMPGDFLRTIEDAHRRLRGDQHKRTTNSVRWNGVIVQIEAHIDGLTGLDGENQICFERVGRQRKEPGLFFLKRLLYGPRVVAGPGTAMGNLVTPEDGLLVKVVQRRKGPCGKE